MKYMTGTPALTGGLLKIFEIISNIASICSRQTDTAYLVEIRGHRKLIAICGKFSALSCGIWKKLPRETVVRTYDYWQL